MKEELITLQSALCTISTKGQDTVTMADCFKFISQLIEKEGEKKCQESESKQ